VVKVKKRRGGLKVRKRTCNPDASWLVKDFEYFVRTHYDTFRKKKREKIDVIFMKCRGTKTHYVPYGAGSTSYEDAVSVRANYDDLVLVRITRKTAKPVARWVRATQRWEPTHG
jgi:hypothetical protein